MPKCARCWKMAIAIIILYTTFLMAKSIEYRNYATDQDQLVQDVLCSTPFIDGHNDVPFTMRTITGNLSIVNLENDLTTIEPWKSHPRSQTDVPRLLKGGVSSQFWIVYVPCKFQYKNALQITLEQIDMIKRFINVAEKHLTFATSAEDTERAFKEGKIASYIGIEGGHSIDSSLGVLRMLYELGVRYLSPTHDCNTPWADASTSNDNPEHNGLTDFGKEVIREMNRLGMMVDLSHTSFKTIHDAIEVSKAPVIFSHSCAYALCKHPRNVPDEILKKIVHNGGIVMVTFIPAIVSCSSNATLQNVADHIEYIRKVAGIDYVGISGDFDGMEVTPKGLEDVSKYPFLFKELVDRGWTKEMLKKLINENFLRVFRKVEEVRDMMKRQNVNPSEYEIPLESTSENNCRTSW